MDAQLARYREMRDFSVTAEPSGGPTASQGFSGALPFIVQKHAATRLHYDFRLGLHGVLKSWAVTKGPSYYPGDKRLAVQVEDHPIEYGGFEGTIPKGQYGGGTVMLWDEGTWEPLGDADEGLAKGNLKFTLHGAKLKGRWVLVRMGGRAAQEGKPNWLLIKEHDEFERGVEDAQVTEQQPDSVITGRGLDAIASSQDHVWESNRDAKQDTKRSSLAREAKAAAKASEPAGAAPVEPPGELSKAAAASIATLLNKAPKESLPPFIPPQLASQATAPPKAADWVHELKLDGYRVQAHVQSRGKGSKSHARLNVTLYTRKGLDWTARMPAVAADVAHLPVESAILDGEVVVLDDAGLSSFAELQAAFQQGEQKHMVYFAFDLLHLNGRNLRELPLGHRKQLLRTLVEDTPSGDALRFSEDIEGRGAEMFAEACRVGAEGVVSKLATSTYTSGRVASWVKAKCVRQQEFVIGGFTLPSNGSNGVGALLLGFYEDGKLVYAGRSGTGFTQKTAAMLRARLEELKRSAMPFRDAPADARRDAIWVKPELVAEVQFRTWTADGLVRQSSFKGLREDKPATEVVREVATIADLQEVEAAGSRIPGTETAALTPLQGSSTLQDTAAKTIRSQVADKDVAAKTAAPHRRASLRRGGSQASQDDSAGRHIEHKGASALALSLPVRLTHPDKLLDQQSRLTKQLLAEYYFQIAPHMLPHIQDRPLSIIRCPDGSGQQCFFQRHVNRSLPKGIGGISIREKNGNKIEEFITLSTAEALTALAQMNVLELHPWGSHNEDIERPDRLIFDLDPDEAISWTTLADAAREIHSRLDQWGLRSFLKTTGGKGLHVVAPIDPEFEWPVVKDFAHAFVMQMEQANPRLYLTKMTKAARKGKIYLDYLRNERGATAVAPFSPRARPGSFVSLPMEWKELNAPEVPRFSAADFASWKQRLKTDPWKDLPAIRQSLQPKEAGDSAS
ncbi:MAG TPA: DNA ligase D [Acidisarcina sp.]